MGLKAKTKTFLFRLLSFCNILIGIVLFFSYISKFISPSFFWPAAFLALLFTHLLIITICFFPVWFFIKKKMMYVSLVSILLVSPNILNIFQISFPSSENENSFKLVSYNVRLFDLYNWTENHVTRDKILDFLKEENADVLCLQEFYHSTKPETGFDMVDKLQEKLNKPYKHVKFTTHLRNEDFWGIATFSNYPIIKEGQIVFGKRYNNTCIFSDIVYKEDTFRVYNAHFASIQFKPEDYKLINEINNDEEPKDFVSRSLQIARRMKKAFVEREHQVNLVLEHIKTSPYPALLCGDFNDTPTSYSYNQAEDFLCDAFKESGNGRGKTYIGDFPSFRIDYIWHTPTIKSSKFVTHPEKLSDHKAISCKIEILD